MPNLPLYRLCLLAAGLPLASLSGIAPALAANAPYADIVVLMDESGSMSGEQAWIRQTLPLLETSLISPEIGMSPNQYGLVGFGASAAPAPSRVRSFSIGGAQMGSVDSFVTASQGLVVSGGTEDGYAAINMANGYAYRANAARNYILVTDEDRDNTNAALTYDNMLSGLLESKTLLNAVVNATFRCGDNSVAFGVGGGGIGFKADGAGGYTTCTGVTYSNNNTTQNYVNLALASGGAAWNLNVLRAGGMSAQSFTSAFIDIKVQEISTQPPPIPEPSTYALVGAGGAMLIGLQRQRRKNRLND